MTRFGIFVRAETPEGVLDWGGSTESAEEDARFLRLLGEIEALVASLRTAVRTRGVEESAHV